MSFFNALNYLKNNFFSMELITFLFTETGPFCGLVFCFLIFLVGFGIFMLGALFCGFFQCMIYRVHNKLKLFGSRSFCDFCGKPLGPLDFLPFINYIVLKGCCRHCKAKLPVKYFYTEILSGIIMLALVLSPLHLIFVLPLGIGAIFLFALLLFHRG